VSAKLVRLEKQKKIFRARAVEILRRGLRSLDELDTTEVAERDTLPSAPPPASLVPIETVDPNLAVALFDFDALDPFWSNIGFSRVVVGDPPGETLLGDPGS
jgi:hypothetical protein